MTSKTTGGGGRPVEVPGYTPETNIAPENRPLESWRFGLETTIFNYKFNCELVYP